MWDLPSKVSCSTRVAISPKIRISGRLVSFLLLKKFLRFVETKKLFTSNSYFPPRYQEKESLILVREHSALKFDSHCILSVPFPFEGPFPFLFPATSVLSVDSRLPSIKSPSLHFEVYPSWSSRHQTNGLRFVFRAMLQGIGLENSSAVIQILLRFSGSLFGWKHNPKRF